MNVLYNELRSTVDTYTFTINQGGELYLKVSNGSDRNISIVFTNGRLSEVIHNLHGFDLRSDWYVLGAIASKITELEERYA